MDEEEVLGEETEEEGEEEDEEVELESENGEEVETSLEEMLSKRAKIEEGDDEDDVVLDLDREEDPGSLNVRSIPLKNNEFICRSCHLVKRQSQLADAKRRLCRDCV